MFDANYISSFLTEFAWLGSWLFLILTFIESIPFVGLVIPGATIISIGGFFASQGYLNIWTVVIFASSGAIIGDFLNYYLGSWNGNLIKNKKIINQTIFNNGQIVFKRYGSKSIFFGRFLGPLKQIIPFVAGIAKMKFKFFVFWDIISILSWALSYIFLGYFSGTLIVSVLKKWTDKLGLILVSVLIIYLIFWLIKEHQQSLSAYFKSRHLGIAGRLRRSNWFNNLKTKHQIINVFLEENEYALKKLFGGLFIFIILLALYFLFY